MRARPALVILLTNNSMSRILDKISRFSDDLVASLYGRISLQA